MPPKAGRKRSRDSTGSTPTPIPTSSAAAPGSEQPAAALSTESSSVSSQQADDASRNGNGSGGGDDPRAAKRSRIGGSAGLEADSADDVEMSDAVVEAGNGATQAGAPATDGKRRKSTSAVVANGKPTGVSAQPPSKKGRKSTSAVATGAAVKQNGGAGAVVAGPGGGRPTLLSAATAAATVATPRVQAGTRGVVVGRAGAEPRSAVPPPASNGVARVVTAAAASSSGATVIGNDGRAAIAAEQTKAQQEALEQQARAHAQAKAKAKAQARARAQASSSSSTAPSPVPATRLRCVTGPESTDGCGDGGSGGDVPAREQDGGGVFGRLRGMVSRAKVAWATACGKYVSDGGVEVRDVLPVVQGITLRFLLLLVFLVGARFVWVATLRVAGGLGGVVGNGDSGNSESVGISPREAALSLIRESEGFKSLEGVLGERRRLLQEMKKQDAHEQGKLQGLRNFVRNLDDQMELLRKQAADAAASRGAPENPEASKEVAISQLEEIKVMQLNLATLMEATRNTVEEGQAWAASASEELDALVARSPPPDQLSPETKAEIHAQAHQEWAEVFSKPIEEAFLALEDVSIAREDLDGLARTKLSSKRSADLVRQVEEAKQSVPPVAKDGDGKLRQRVKAIAEREVAIKWGEATGTGGSNDDRFGSDAQRRTLRTTEEAEELVAQEVEFFTSGGMGMPDYASLTPGARVVQGTLRLSSAAAAAAPSDYDGSGWRDEGEGVEAQLTSPTLASTMLPWADYLLHVLRVPGRVMAETADAALSASNTLGSCFAFQGGQGRLTVQLAPPVPSSSPSSSSWRARGFIKVTHVSIEHARTASAPTALKSAPRKFRVLGWDADPSAPETTASLIGVGGGGVGEGRRRGGGGGGREGEVLRPYVLLEGAEYQAGGGALAVQTFAVSETGGDQAPPVGWATLEVQSNYGGKWTCLYGFRVHGDPVF